MPSYGTRQEPRLFRQLLGIVLAEVELGRVREAVEGKDVGGGFELGHGNNAYLVFETGFNMSSALNMDR